MVEFASHMNESDAVLWCIERDPRLRSTIVAVAILDTVPDWVRLRNRIEAGSRLVPRLRQRVVEAPGRLGPPRWVVADDFDLDYHLRRVQVPAPGDQDSLLALCAPIAMAAFDKDRPLWEFTLVEGLVGGRAALVQKVHHSLTDGVGGMMLAAMLLDAERHPSQEFAAGQVPEPESLSRLDLAEEALADDMRAVAHLAEAGVRSLPDIARHGATEPRATLRRGIRTARSVGKLLAPVRTPLSPVLVGRGLGRRLETCEVPLDGLKAAAHVAGARLNDAFLAAVVGGLTRYHDKFGVILDELRLTMPINLRPADDGEIGNNRFTPARFVVPATISDPRERVQAIHAITNAWRDEPALPLSEGIAGVLNRLPRAATTQVFGAMLKAVDVVVTDVPGPPVQLFLAGAAVEREFAFAPPSGAAMSIALLSCNGVCCIGLVADTAAVSDPRALIDCLADGFDEVLSLAG